MGMRVGHLFEFLVGSHYNGGGARQRATSRALTHPAAGRVVLVSVLYNCA